MKHDDNKLNMWFSLMISILVHVAVILLVPISLTHHVTVYPVEFGEISQTFASTRQGSPQGTPVPTQPKRQDTAVQEKPAEKQQEPLPKPAPKEPEPPAKETEALIKETEKPREPERQKTEEQPKPEPQIVPKEPEPDSQAVKPEPEAVAEKPEPETVAEEPEPRPDDIGRVLTGESDETIPIPEAKAALPETGDEELPTPGPEAGSDATGDTESPRDANGRPHTTGETGKGEEATTEGKPQDEEMAGPDKPKGHEFGQGESLAINYGPPRYPKGAQNIDLIGTVKLEVTVAGDGKILGVDVSHASGHDELDEQARKTILALWNFKGIDWPYKIQVTVSFRGEADVDVGFGGVTVLED